MSCCRKHVKAKYFNKYININIIYILKHIRKKTDKFN